MTETEVLYDHQRLVDVLIYHQPTNTSGCICGWGVLGASHAEHVVAVYEAASGRAERPTRSTLADLFELALYRWLGCDVDENRSGSTPEMLADLVLDRYTLTPLAAAGAGI